MHIYIRTKCTLLWNSCINCFYNMPFTTCLWFLSYILLRHRIKLWTSKCLAFYMYVAQSVCLHVCLYHFSPLHHWDIESDVTSWNGRMQLSGWMAHFSITQWAKNIISWNWSIVNLCQLLVRFCWPRAEFSRKSSLFFFGKNQKNHNTRIFLELFKLLVHF